MVGGMVPHSRKYLADRAELSLQSPLIDAFASSSKDTRADALGKQKEKKVQGPGFLPNWLVPRFKRRRGATGPTRWRHADSRWLQHCGVPLPVQGGMYSPLQSGRQGGDFQDKGYGQRESKWASKAAPDK